MDKKKLRLVLIIKDMLKLIRVAKVAVPLVTLAGFGAYGVSKCIFRVKGGYRAIKFNRFYGVMPTHYREGWHLFLPYFEWPIIYDVRTVAKVSSSQTGTKDLQLAYVTVRVLYRPMKDRLADLFRAVGEDYDDRVLPSIINEIVKTVIVSSITYNRLNTMQQNYYRKET